MVVNRKRIKLVGWLVVSVLLIEGALQVFYRVRNGYWLLGFETFRVEHLVARDDKRQYALKPGFSDPQRGITIAETGFRQAASISGPEPGAKVIALLGDSVPYGYGVRDEETYPFRLRELFRQRGVDLGVVNAGVPSYNYQQSIEHFREAVRPRYDPVIVTLQAANDIGLFLRHRGLWSPDVTWTPHRPGLSAYLTRSAFFFYLASPLQNVRRGGTDQPPTRLLSHVEKITRGFVGRCTQSGTRVILMPIDPFYYQTAHVDRNPKLARWQSWKASSQGWAQLFDQFNQVLIDLVQDYPPDAGVYFFDTRALLDQLDREKLFADSIHYSPEGNRVVAAGLFDFMAERGLVRARDDAAADSPNPS